jgi:hypothetical protein
MLVFSVWKLRTTPIWSLEISTYRLMDFCEYGYLVYWGCTYYAVVTFCDVDFFLCIVFPDVTCLGGDDRQPRPKHAVFDIIN